ncbi:MAG: response regulator [Deltaproteobacteria bacterium]|jgi:DNA-binding response OmpR family regulator|nr:response regulator [Deltaproteobacteria bacterium]
MTVNSKGYRILVVDDEPEIHAVLAKLLSKEGYDVDSAYNADEAFDSISREKPDLMILDIMMPQVSGIEVCNRIKGDKSTSDILVLIVSARDAQEDRIEGLSHGADDYVSKPFHLRSLVRKIEHMLDKKEVSEFEREIGRK